MTKDVGKLHKMNPNQIQVHATEERQEGKATWSLDAWIHNSVPQCHCFSLDLLNNGSFGVLK